MTILENGTSTIQVKHGPGNVTANDPTTKVAVRVEKDHVILGVEGLPLLATITATAAWSLRDVLTRALTEFDEAAVL